MKDLQSLQNSEAEWRFRNYRPYAFEMSRGLGIMLINLLQDGYLRLLEDHPNTIVIDGRAIVEIYGLTDSGVQFLERWKTAQPLD